MSTTRREARLRRGPGLLAWFVAGLLLLPVLEIAVIIQVGQVIGPWPTLILLVVESALGAWIVRREGGGAWRALNETLAAGRMPGRELADSALILVGGTLLLTPGFITDAAGFFLVIPPTRAVARRLFGRLARGRLTVVATASAAGGSGFAASAYPDGGVGGGVGRTIPGEVVDDQ